MRTPIVWHILGACFLQIWAVGVVRVVFTKPPFSSLRSLEGKGLDSRSPNLVDRSFVDVSISPNRAKTWKMRVPLLWLAVGDLQTAQTKALSSTNRLGFSKGNVARGGKFSLEFRGLCAKIARLRVCPASFTVAIPPYIRPALRGCMEGGLWNGHFQSPKNICQRTKFSGISQSPRVGQKPKGGSSHWCPWGGGLGSGQGGGVYAWNRHNVVNWRSHRETVHIFGPKWVNFRRCGTTKTRRDFWRVWT